MKSQFKHATRVSRLALLVAFFSILGLVGVKIAQAEWSSPVAPPPGGNTSAPINVSGSAQTKQGSLTVAGEYLKADGAYLVLTTGDAFFVADNAGVFWANEDNSPSNPHINYSLGTVYISAGDAGTAIENQGDVTITRADANQGSLEIINSVEGRTLTLALEDGAAGGDVKSTGSPLFVNYFSGAGEDIYLAADKTLDSNPGGQDLIIGSDTHVVRVCFNDDGTGAECITGWDQTGGSGGLWTLDATPDPDVVYLDETTSTRNVGIGTQLAQMKLHIAAQVGQGILLEDLTNTKPTYLTNENGWFQINAGGGNGIKIISDGATKTLIVNDDKVGIGTDTPNVKLEIDSGVNNTSGLRFTQLAGCTGANTLDTDANGNIVCGTDDGGGGGTDEYVKVTAGELSADYLMNQLTSSDSSVNIALVGGIGENQTLDLTTSGGSGLWEMGVTANTINPVNEATDKVAIGRNDIGDNTQLSVKNTGTVATDKAIYAEQAGAGYSGYFSGKFSIVGSGNNNLRLEETSGGEYFDINIDTSGDLNILNDAGTNTLAIEDSTGDVGINDSSPSYKLDVNGDINVQTGFVYSHAGSAGTSGSPFCNGDDIVVSNLTVNGGIVTNVSCESDDGGSGGGIVSTGTTAYVTRFTNGAYEIGNSNIYNDNFKVGVGVTDMTHRFEVGESIGGYMALRRNDNFITTGEDLGAIYFNGDDGSTNAIGAEIKAISTADWSLNDSPTQLTFWTAPDGSTVQQRMMIGSGGNVGIGIPDPQNKLDVGETGGGYQALRRNDSVIVDGEDLGALYFSGDDGGDGSIGAQIKGRATADWSPNDYPTKLMFYTSPDGSTTQERMVIESGGDVGIGTSDPKGKLNLYDDDASVILLQDALSGTGVGDGFEISQDGVSTYVWNYENGSIQFGTNDNYRMTITGSGNIGIGDTSPAALLTVGSGDKFQVASDGDIQRIKNVVYDWPAAQGGASTVLTNNGSGTLSWAAAGGSSYWTLNGTDLYPNNTGWDVGVGTNNPAHKLHVVGDMRLDGVGDLLYVGGTDMYIGEVIGGDMDIVAGDNPNFKWGDGAGNGTVDFIRDSTTVLNIFNDGALRGNINHGGSGGMVRVSTTSGYLDIGSDNASYAHLYTDRAKFYFNKKIISNGGFSSYGSDNLVLQTGETTRITILGNAAGDPGFVGINDSSPSYQLDVSGNANATQLCISGDCRGSWPSGLGGSGTANRVAKFTAATTLSDSQITDDGSEVGIGQTNPTVKLHVNGPIYSQGNRIFMSSYGANWQAGVSAHAHETLCHNCAWNGSNYVYTNTHASFGTRMIAFQYGGSTPDAPGQGIHFYEKSGSTTTGNTISWDDPQFSIMNTIVKFDERVNVGISNGAPAAKLVINNGTSGNGLSGTGLAIYTSTSDPSLYVSQADGDYAGLFEATVTEAHADPAWDDYSVIRAINTASSSTGIGIIGVGGTTGTTNRGSYGLVGFGRNATGSTGRSAGVFGYSNATVSSSGTKAGVWGQVTGEDDGYAYGVYGYNPSALGDYKNYAVFSNGDFGAPNNYHGTAQEFGMPNQPDGSTVMCGEGDYVCGVKFWDSAGNEERDRLTDIICCEL